MTPLLRNIIRSFPVQLLLLHLRRNLLLLFFWTVITGMMAGWIAPDMGMQYLFLDPEYLGQVSYWSFLIMGMAFGFYVMSWNLSTYLLLGRNFEFLACLSRPFLKFCINNALLPLAVFITYLVMLYRFNAATSSWGQLMESWLGLLSGLVLSLLLYMVYFYLTNRDVNYYTGKRSLAPNQHIFQPMGRQEGQEIMPLLSRENPYRIRYYIDSRLRNRLVRSVAHYERATIENVYRYSHSNAVILQLTSVVTLVLLGLLIDYKIFQFPAGASLLVLLSILIFCVGVINYWFAEWRLTIFIVFLIGVNWLTSLKVFQRSNYAYGISYAAEPVAYNEARLRQLALLDQVSTDSLATVKILDNWLAKQQKECPKMVLICTSGGGLSAAYWGMHVVQELEKATEGAILDRTMLMTGASGGMMGMAYLRELYHQAPETDPLDEVHLSEISLDLINPIAFSIVSNDIFLPFTEVKVGDEKYLRDRAYSFERQFSENTGGLLDVALADLREAEQTARIPMMILTPTIVNDGRLLAISPQNVSYLMSSPIGRYAEAPLSPDVVDLGSLLGENQRDSLRFLTALRMNATYPYILPFVQLPTEPIVRVMDAGYRDNYGVLTATRFVQNFAPWIADNVCEVVMIQISAFKGGKEHSGDDAQGVVESLLGPVGLADNVFEVQSLEQENSLAYLYELLGRDKFHLLRFNYKPKQDDHLRASISFHLTKPEREELRNAMQAPELQEEVARTVKILKR